MLNFNDENEKQTPPCSGDQQANLIPISKTEKEELREAKERGEEDIEKRTAQVQALSENVSLLLFCTF